MRMMVLSGAAPEICDATLSRLCLTNILGQEAVVCDCQIQSCLFMQQGIAKSKLAWGHKEAWRCQSADDVKAELGFLPLNRDLRSPRAQASGCCSQ